MWLWFPTDYSSKGLPVPPLEPIGEPQERQFSVAFLRDIGERLEQEFNDVPSEYLVLQAAGMYILRSSGVVKGNSSLKAVLHEAQKILQSLGVQRTITETHEKKVEEVVKVQPARVKTNTKILAGETSQIQFKNVQRKPIDDYPEEGFSFLLMVDRVKDMVKDEVGRFLDNNPIDWLNGLVSKEPEEVEVDPEMITAVHRRLSKINGSM